MSINNRAAGVLYESEATLRLVEGELGALNAGLEPDPVVDEAPKEGRSMLESLPHILQLANDELMHVVQSLRDSRRMLEPRTVESLPDTHATLRDVASATETATTAILDALDRAQGLMDTIDAEGATKESSENIKHGLRNEIFGIIGALPFQDITTQQITDASNVLLDMEATLLRIMQFLDPSAASA